MASKVRVSCINKSNRTNPHERITSIGGVNPDGTNWKMAESKAIEKIEDGTYNFYVSQGGNTVDVIIATREGRKYLKTSTDGVSPDNLLSLPECP
jgi:hypothetical protein